MAHYAPGIESGSDNHLKETVELHIACRDVVKADLLSQSDPFVLVSLRGDNGKFLELGRTEVVYNVTNTEFAACFAIDYFFEKEQRLKFDVYDEDKRGSARLADHDFLGTCHCTLGEIVHSPGATMPVRLTHLNGKPMRSKKQYSRLILSAAKVAGVNEKFDIALKCLNLPKMDTLGKIDGYLRVCKVEDTEKVNYNLNDFKTRALVTTYKSETVQSNYNPQFRSFLLEGGRLFGRTETSQKFEVQIYDWDKSSDDEFVGSVLISSAELKECHKQGASKTFDIDLHGKLARKYAKKKDKDRPKLVLVRCKQQASMLDFLQGGCDFSLMTAVDYTGSNLEHPFGSNPGHDLHHLNYNTGHPSQYQLGIRKIGNILQAYDSDQMYPLWGFGLKGPFVDNPNNPNTRHGFNVNVDMLGFQKEEVAGIYGLENCYLASLGLLRSGTFYLSGPTYFSHILSNARDEAKASFAKYKAGTGRLTYFIFLIITDGAVSTEDMLRTINVIVDIAEGNLPVSIIIVGVGKGPFDTMNLLDGDFLQDVRKIEQDPKMKSKQKEDAVFALLQENNYRPEHVGALQKIGDRDIVDFIELSEFDPVTLKNKQGQSLESCTLKEIPTHFLKFIEKNNIAIPDRIETKEQDFDMAVGVNQFGAVPVDLGGLDQSQGDMYYPDLANTQAQQVYGKVNYWDDAPLPPGWERGFMPNGRMYYVSHNLRVTQWMHPDDPTAPQKAGK